MCPGCSLTVNNMGNIQYSPILICIYPLIPLLNSWKVLEGSRCYTQKVARAMVIILLLNYT